MVLFVCLIDCFVFWFCLVQFCLFCFGFLFLLLLWGFSMEVFDWVWFFFGGGGCVVWGFFGGGGLFIFLTSRFPNHHSLKGTR